MTASYLKLAGGYVYDPLNGVDGQVQDIWILDDKIVVLWLICNSFCLVALR